MLFQRGMAAAAGAALLAVLAPSAVAQSVAKISSKGCVGFVGQWDTNFGPMQLSRGPGGIKGRYQWKSPYGQVRSDLLSGTVTGNVLKGTIAQPGYPDAGKTNGNIRFELNADGNSFSGTWAYTDGENGQWTGTCIGK